ncbi:MAG TPA: sensor histidine kinase [Solirubrobacteraceae bacterium]|nr:sensor histidine kinase [Solirubrobacteraceae bacterium]
MTAVVGAHSWRRERTARRPDVATELGGPALIGAVLGLCATAESVVRSAVTGVSVQRALVLCLVALATTLPPAVASRLPAAVTVAAASVVSLTLFHTLTIAAVVAQLIALSGVGRGADPRTAPQLLVGCLPLAFLVLALTHPVPASSEAGVLTILLASLGPATALAGVAWRAHREALRIDAAREAAAGDLLAHAARGERARIARELHDVVAHHISMIAVQAETARVTTPGMPPAGAQRLTAIGDTARSALTEMRRLLGVLREDAEIDAPDLRPQPSLQQLNELLDQTRDTSGSAARLILSGPPSRLDPGVELAAYRIVQEALTNARRHAPGAAVDVELRYGSEALSLRIRDNGPGPVAAAATGHGLTGMRERALAVGGRLHTGPTPAGGFIVEATLPIGDVEAPG